VSQGIAEVMARVTRMPEPEFIPTSDIEPISLNIAYQLRGFLVTEHLKSVLVVTPGFRSQRSSLVYHAVLGPVCIIASCVPLFGEKTSKNWSQTWHGIQEVIEQWLKLQHYCCLVKPFGLRFCINPDLSPRLEHQMAESGRGSASRRYSTV
jgi:hypothetical protein